MKIQFIRERFCFMRTSPLAILFLLVLAACRPTPTPLVEASPLPDLTVTSINLYMQTEVRQPCVDAYAPYEVRVQVANQGQTPADAVTVEGWNGRQEPLGSLAAGERRELRWPADSATGEYTVRIDPQNQVAESDEENNVRSYRAPTPTPPPLCPTATPVAPPPTPEPSPTFVPTPVPPAGPTPVPPQTGEPVCIASNPMAVGFMPDSQRLLVKSDAGIQILDLQTLEVTDLLKPLTNIFGFIRMSPDGEKLAWSLDDFSVQLYHIPTRETLTLTGHTNFVSSLVFSPQGDRLYSGSHDGWVRAWDMTGSEVAAYPYTGDYGFSSEVVGMGISPSGDQLGVIPSDGPLVILDIESLTPSMQLRGSGGYDTSQVVFSPGGQYAAADLATGLFLWDLADGTELLGGNPGINTSAVTFSPDGRYLAYAEVADNYPIVLRSPDGSEIISLWEGHETPVWEIFFSPDSSLLVTGGVDLLIWQVDGGKLLYTSRNACP